MDRERCPVGHQTTEDHSDLTPLTTTPLLHEAQKKHLSIMQCLSTYTITKQFAFKKFVWRDDESIFQNPIFSPVIYYCNQLSFTTMPFPECMLFVRKKNYIGQDDP